MNEFNLNSFDQETENEIDRIQREINKDLQAAEVMPEPVVSAEQPLHEEQPADDTRPVYEAPIAPVISSAPYKETIKKEKSKNGKRQWLRTVVAACIVAVIGGPLAGLAIGVGQQAAVKYFGTAQAEPQAPPFAFENKDATPIAVAPNSSSIIDNFSAIVDAVEPSVVGITSISSGGDLFFPSLRDRSPNQGSGIIFDEDTENVYIVTNYHVVTGANKVGISVEGKEPVSAALVGAEKAADIAVISVLKQDLDKIGVKSVTKARFGDSEEMKVGEIVLAIGNALGEGNTATLGIVSAKSKDIYVEGLSLTVMQTDAAINPGNSGGPLVNVKGEVVAINTAKFQLYDVEGTGYSIPVSEAKPIIERLRNKTPKPFMGIEMADVTEEIAELYNLPALGVLVSDVIPDTAAEKAGILRNDVITGLDGKPVLSREDLADIIGEHTVGDKVEVKLYRRDKGAITIDVTLGEMPVSATF